MTRTSFTLSLLSFYTLALFAQPVEIGQMTNTISEPSGLAMIYNTSTGHFDYWVHNDAGNLSEFHSFRINDLMTITRTIDPGVTMIDWEDMTTDDDDNIYIGDFGNWANATQFRILKIPNPNTYPGNPASVDIIEYEYPGLIDFDNEAIIHFNNHLYIFTKANETDPTDELTHCYKIPDVPHPMGLKYQAELVGSFMTKLAGDVDPDTHRVTAAAISPNKNVLVLNTYYRVWVFSCFEGDDFFNGSVQHFDMSPSRQYEGLCFVNNHELVMSKEGALANPTYNPKLYHLNIAPYIDEACLDCNKIRNGNFAKANEAWSMFNYGTASGVLFTADALGHIDIASLGTSSWHINMRHKSLILELGKTYQVSYKAYAAGNRTMAVIFSDQTGSTNYHYHNENLSTTPTYYTYTFTMTDPTDYTAYMSFNVGRDFIDDVYIDDVVLAEVGDCPVGTIDLDVSVILQGPYDSSLGLMDDQLRANSLLPDWDPFNNITKIYPATVFSTVGNDAIVDWVTIELRRSTTPNIVSHERAALLQADGNVVDIDGVSPVVFNAVPLGAYHIAVRHRNHLGVMTIPTVIANPW